MNNKLVWIAIILILLTVGVLSFYIDSEMLAGIFKKDPPVVQNNNPEITVTSTKIALESESPFFIPNSSTTTKSNANELDKDLSRFIISNPINVSIDKTVFSDGTNGFVITYELNKSVGVTYDEFVSFSNKTPFKIVYAAEANLAAIITTESLKYRVKVVAEKSGTDSSKVRIEIQGK